MENAIKLIEIIQQSKTPSLLIILGGIFLLLGFIGKLGGYIELNQKRQKLAGFTGVLILFIGIFLSAYSPSDDSSQIGNEPINTRIAGGERFFVSFSKNICDDAGCGVSSEDSKIGTLISGEEYSVKFLPEKDAWEVSGPNQGLKDCKIKIFTNKNNNDPKHFILLWGREFEYNDKGDLLELAGDGQSCGPKGGVVGQIRFEP